MRRPFAIFFVIVFAAVLALPGLANCFGVDGGDAEAENRVLAAFPHWDGTLASAVAYPDRFDAWFEDHFALRSTLVRWYGQALWSGLGMSASSSVVRGNQGWLYYADDGGMADYASGPALDEDAVTAWHESIVRARDWLRGCGVAYVFTVVPDKHTIYPEHLPSSIRRAPGPTRTDQVFKALAGSGIDAVDVRVAERAAKDRERLFALTDTHWNDLGAFVAYQQIIEAVRRQVPSTPPAFDRTAFDVDDREIPGQDLARLMVLSSSLHDRDLRLVPRQPRRARVVEPPGAGMEEGVGRLVTQIDDPALPTAVIFRDSFASRLAPFLSEHFRRAVYVWQNDFDPELVVKEHPDVVIQEIVGRHLYMFIPSPELVPNTPP